VIVNADDFGQSRGVNAGIIEAHERGFVTSASLMVRWPAAAEAAAYARSHPRLAVGLHLDLGEWACLDGTWVARYEVVPPDDAAAVAGEVARQLAAFRDLMGRDPTHIDSHQHVHRGEPAKSPAVELARRAGVPLRGCTPGIHYCGGFYGQATDGTLLPEILTPDGLIRILAELPPGVSELGCHPGRGDDLDTTYLSAREVAVLCAAQVRSALNELGIELRSFGNVTSPAGPECA
jgi:predicted glycoside hydrolase/deacetylase ChbG (UPF0249 family)